MGPLLFGWWWWLEDFECRNPGWCFDTCGWWVAVSLVRVQVRAERAELGMKLNSRSRFVGGGDDDHDYDGMVRKVYSGWW